MMDWGISFSAGFVVNEEHESEIPGVLMEGVGSAIPYDPHISRAVGRIASETFGVVGDVIGKSLDGNLDERDIVGIGGGWFAGAVTGAGLGAMGANPITITIGAIASRRVRDFTHHPYLTTIPAMQNIPPPTRQSY